MPSPFLKPCPQISWTIPSMVGAVNHPPNAISRRPVRAPRRSLPQGANCATIASAPKFAPAPEMALRWAARSCFDRAAAGKHHPQERMPKGVFTLVSPRFLQFEGLFLQRTGAGIRQSPASSGPDSEVRTGNPCRNGESDWRRPVRRVAWLSSTSDGYRPPHDCVLEYCGRNVGIADGNRFA